MQASKSHRDTDSGQKGTAAVCPPESESDAVVGKSYPDYSSGSPATSSSESSSSERAWDPSADATPDVGQSNWAGAGVMMHERIQLGGGRKVTPGVASVHLDPTTRGTESPSGFDAATNPSLTADDCTHSTTAASHGGQCWVTHGRCGLLGGLLSASSPEPNVTHENNDAWSTPARASGTSNPPKPQYCRITYRVEGPLSSP